MAVGRYGVEKYSPAGLLASSADRGWSGLSAELRSHGDGVVARKSTQPNTEVSVDIRGNGSVATRQTGGVFERTVAERGTIWLSPAGLQEDFVDLSDPVPEILHIYLPSSRLSTNSLGEDLYRSVVASLAKSLTSILAARPARAFPRITQQGLDRRRLSRVLDYIEANLEGDLTLDRLASIACLSRFHFARAFKAAVGRSPHRYVSAKRLDRAKALLIQGEQSLVDIALALNFSCQANFTRAFRQATGRTPGQYRRSSG